MAVLALCAVLWELAVPLPALASRPWPVAALLALVPAAAWGTWAVLRRRP